jgi:hypothetical protein
MQFYRHWSCTLEPFSNLGLRTLDELLKLVLISILWLHFLKGDVHMSLDVASFFERRRGFIMKPKSRTWSTVLEGICCYGSICC